VWNNATEAATHAFDDLYFLLDRLFEVLEAGEVIFVHVKDIALAAVVQDRYVTPERGGPSGSKNMAELIELVVEGDWICHCPKNKASLNRSREEWTDWVASATVGQLEPLPYTASLSSS
jgi:hypothetical protein